MATVYEIVTEQIIKQLESGVAPWRKPWSGTEPCNYVSRKAYRGINTFLLGATGYSSPYWMTYKQAQSLGGFVRKGEHGNIVVFWNVGEEKLNAKTGKLSKPFLLRYYRVFNASQIEGLAQRPSDLPERHVDSIAECERLVADMPKCPPIGLDAKACYYPDLDRVGMPLRDSFATSEGYYATLFHELTHATGHATRVNRSRDADKQYFGSELYAKEELIAEMGSAMLCGIAGISPAVIDNSASYLASWIKVLRGDSKLVVTAASAAQKAADYIRGVKAEHGAE